MTGTVITVGGAVPVFDSFADYFDGARAMPQRVALGMQESAAGGTLTLQPPEGAEIAWPLDQIRGVPDQADRRSLMVALADDPVARLLVTDPVAVGILRARCRNLHKRPPVKGKWRLAAWALAAVASVALIILVLVPVMADQLAEYLPPEGEKALGDTTLEQIRNAMGDGDFTPLQFCEAEAGRASLDLMSDRIMQGLDLPYPVQVHVLDGDLINAFALPGGHIVFFRGLIEAADRPEEVAAVFAHELGHVVHRDPARGALRSAGSIGVLGLLLGDFAGGTAVLFMTERLIEASYSQDAEADADEFAHAQLRDVDLPPDALASMFRRLRDKYGDADGIVAHFMAHPTLGNRIARARVAAQDQPRPLRPLMSDAEWQSLRSICG